VAFSPDGQYLFLTVGDRQRMTPAQDPDQPVGKILRLTLDGKPVPGNPNFGKTGAATIPLIDPPRDTEVAKTAKPVSTYTFPGPNLTPAETWASGFRAPYGLAFSPTGELWEVEHGPRGGDELNLIEKGKNYGWPVVSYGMNYNEVPIPSHNTRPEFTKPVLYWVPVIAPGNLMFYRGTKTFPQWNGSGFISGLGTHTLNRIIFDGKGGAKTAERWDLGKRMRDVEARPRWSLWMLKTPVIQRPDPCDTYSKDCVVISALLFSQCRPCQEFTFRSTADQSRKAVPIRVDSNILRTCCASSRGEPMMPV
jgi:glucose/arabinose dehydrogenase